MYCYVILMCFDVKFLEIQNFDVILMFLQYFFSFIITLFCDSTRPPQCQRLNFSQGIPYE